MDYLTLQTNFERELLFQIIFKLGQKKLEKARARKVAQAFLPTLKSIDAPEFIKRNAKLSEFYPEILEAFLVTVKEYDRQKTEINLIDVRQEMKGGEI